MTLEETIPLMLSNDWRDRLKAEYWQTRIRLEKLRDYERNCVEGNIAHDIYSQISQTEAMERYLAILGLRLREHEIRYEDENEREDKE